MSDVMFCPKCHLLCREECPKCGARRKLRAPEPDEPVLLIILTSGFCSAQPGLGVYSGYSCVDEAMTAPVSLIMIHFAPEVPTSRPIRYFIVWCLPFIIYFLFLKRLRRADSLEILPKSSRFSSPWSRRTMFFLWQNSASAPMNALEATYQP